MLACKECGEVARSKNVQGRSSDLPLATSSASTQGDHYEDSARYCRCSLSGCASAWALYSLSGRVRTLIMAKTAIGGQREDHLAHQAHATDQARPRGGLDRGALDRRRCDIDARPSLLGGVLILAKTAIGRAAA